jgi:organic radical activating enzyme
MNSNIDKDTFCALAHRGLHIDNKMNVKPCCVFTNFKTPVIYDQNKTILECLNAPQFIDLRDKLNRGEPHEGCSNCFNGRTNYRTDINQLFETQSEVLDEYTKFLNLETTEVNYIDMRISNKCNFKCIMCCDMYSSAWEVDLKKIYPGYVPTDNFELSKNWKEHFTEIKETIKFIYFSGGEPFIMDETFDLIDLLGDSSKEISIFVNTNLSTLNYKDRFVLDYFKKFKQVVFHISCDGFGEIGEYIRFGFKTEKFKNNVNKLLDFIKINSTNSKIEYDITYAKSIINVYNIFEFLDTLKSDLGIDDSKVNFQTVGSPYNLSVSSLSLDEKERISKEISTKMLGYSDQTVDRLSKFIETINTTTITDFFDSTLDTGLIKNIDALRGNNIGKFVSEENLKHLKINKTII